MNEYFELKEFHESNVEKYVGKETDKGTIESVTYLTFVGAYGGSYSSYPKPGKQGLICGQIGSKAVPIGELKFINQPK